MAKKVLITEAQLDFLIDRLVFESMSIANDVRDITYRLLSVLEEKFKEATTESNKGSLQISIFGAEFTINWVLYFVNSIHSIPRIGANIDFKENVINVSAINFMGKLDMGVLADSLQHEIEHLYQKLQKPNEEIFSKKDSLLYDKVLEILSSADCKPIEYNIARAVYLTFEEEQDAYVNGLYAALSNKECFNPTNYHLAFKRSDAYRQLDFLRKFYNSICENEEGLIADKDFLNATKFLKRDYKWLLNHIDKAIRRFSRKIAHVQRKVNGEQTDKLLGLTN